MANPTDDLARSKHIFVLQTDIVDYKGHMKLDAVMQKCLDESENQRLKNPITPDDYLELFKTIVIETGYLIKYKTLEDRVSVVKAKFLEPGIESPEWKDFTRMLDMCLERGRFRAVRVMWDFYTDASEEFYAKVRLDWEYATKYFIDGNFD